MNTEPKQPLDGRILANLTAICGCLRAAAVQEVVVRYSGGGDSGQAEEITATDAAGAEIILLDTQPVLIVESAEEAEPRAVHVEDALNQSLWDVIAAYGHAHFEDRSGGQGTLTLTADGLIRLDHEDNYHSVDEYTHATTLPLPPLDSRAPLPTCMAA